MSTSILTNLQLWSRWQESNLLPWVCNPVPVQLAPPTFISGTPTRNRTSIRSLEDCCIIHYTMGIKLVRVVGLEPTRTKARDFKSLVSTYSTILALTLLYIKQSCMSTTIWCPCWDSNSEQLLLLRETTFPICPQGHLVGWLWIEHRLDRLWVDCFTIKLSAQ